jgi:hypothetical protein
MMNVQDVLREMREWADRDYPQIGAWADALEEAMREPVAWVYPEQFWDHLQEVNAATAYRLPGNPEEGRTPLFEFPLDAAGEIERLQACFRQLLNEAETVMAAYGTTNLAAVLSARFIADLARTALAKEDKP